MSNITLSSLKYITRESLASHTLSSASGTLPPNIAVIDVRDSDHVGGHIRGSTWVPSSQLDYKLPELIRTLKDKEMVVFHCALSQQRGPSAALRYLREKGRLEPAAKVESGGVVCGGGGEGEGEGKLDNGKKNDDDDDEEEEEEGKGQKVVVLSGGFTKWQEKYGEDSRLTEGYQKDIWEFGY